MNDHMRVGLIGAGGIAVRHLSGYAAHSDRVRVTAVADVVEENARRLLDGSDDVPIYTDYQDMLAKEQLDAVDICLPHHLHTDAIVAAAEAGLDVLCEKPLCLTLEEASRIDEVIQRTGITLMCAHNQLFRPPVAKARQLIDDGAIGAIYELRTTDSFVNNFDPSTMGWRAHRETAGGGELIDTGYHPTYVLLHLADSSPVEVFATTSRHRLHFMEGEDSAQVLVRFANGALGTIVTSWAYDPPPVWEKFSVIGEKGTLWSDGIVLHHKVPRGETTTYRPDPVDMFSAEIGSFVDCVQEGVPPLNSHVDGISVLKVILAAYESSNSKRAIALS